MPIIKRLEGKRVLILLASEFDDSEFRDVAGALLLEGAEITVASTVKDVLRGLHGDEAVIPDELVRDVNVQGFTGLYIPGGKAPSKIRADPGVQKVVKRLTSEVCESVRFVTARKCLISAGIVKNKTLTSHPTVGRELQEAGANYSGRPWSETGA